MLAIVAAVAVAEARPQGGRMKLEAEKTVPAALAEARAERVAFAPDGNGWATAAPGQVDLWQGELHVHGFEAAQVQSLAFSRDGGRLFFGPHRARLEPIELEEAGDVLAPSLNRLQARYELTAARFFPDGNELAVIASFRAGGGLHAGSARPEHSEQVLVLDGKTHQVVHTLWRGREPRFRVLAVDARHVAAAQVDVWLWARDGRGARRVLEGGEYGVQDLRFNGDGTLLAAVDADGMVSLWETAGGKLRARWKVTEDNAARLAFHPRLPLLATASGDGALKLWSFAGTAAPVLAGTLAGAGAVEDLVFSPSGERLLAAVDGKPRFFTIAPAGP